MEVPVCVSSQELASPQGRRLTGGRMGCLAVCLTAPQDRAQPPRPPGRGGRGRRSRSPAYRLCLVGLTPAGGAGV